MRTQDRWMAIVLAALLTVGLSACGSAEDESVPAADTAGEAAEEGSVALEESSTLAETSEVEGSSDDTATASVDAGDSGNGDEGDGEAEGTSAAGTEEADEAAADDVEMVAVKLDLNTASSEELATVPGAAGKMVREFEEYRPYISILQFRREMAKYVDDATIAGYEEYLYVPVDPNESDVATLAQLPGVDEAAAESLMAGRPFATYDDFLSLLATLVDPADAETAVVYLVAE